jgi:hypothetical protein
MRFPDSVSLIRANRDHRRRGVSNDVFGNATDDDPVKPTPPVRPDHDQIDLILTGIRNQCIARCPTHSSSRCCDANSIGPVSRGVESLIPSVLEFGMLSGILGIYRRLSSFQHVDNVECRIEFLCYLEGVTGRSVRSITSVAGEENLIVRHRSPPHAGAGDVPPVARPV